MDSTSAIWTTSADIEAQVLRLWERGQLLRAAITGASMYPLALKLKRPSRSELGTRFDDVRRWIRELEDGSRVHRGYGYDIEFVETGHRQLGRNRVPRRILVPTEEDALRLIHKTRPAKRFQELSSAILTAFETLRPWVEVHALKVLEYDDRWSRILRVLSWFRANPRSDLYLRQLEIEGIDSKFIETERAILYELLDAIGLSMPGGPGTTFEQRFGLRRKPFLVRFRLLDASQTIHGFSDLTVPLDELGNQELPTDDVFITENEVNALAFPPRAKTIVLFGQGYAAEKLGEIKWLGTRRVFYWGDIDTHGFAALDRLRQWLPSVTSWLMDLETLLTHRSMWVEEFEQQAGPLLRLTEPERVLFRELRNDTHGPRVRLEQERISYAWVGRALSLLQ